MRIATLLVVLMGLPMIGHARDTMDGCGLGWEVTDSETMIGTTTRATTNNIVPPSFGMTTGTLGCKKLAFASNEKDAVNYVVNNYSNLKQELATGRGEYVDGLKEVMKCNTQAVQKNFSSVVAPTKDGVELYSNLQNACG